MNNNTKINEWIKQKYDSVKNGAKYYAAIGALALSSCGPHHIDIVDFDGTIGSNYIKATRAIATNNHDLYYVIDEISQDGFTSITYWDKDNDRNIDRLTISVIDSATSKENKKIYQSGGAIFYAANKKYKQLRSDLSRQKAVDKNNKDQETIDKYFK
jgi:hypothetical protein